MKYFIRVYIRFLSIINVIAGCAFFIICLNKYFGIVFDNDIVPQGINMILVTCGIVIPMLMILVGGYSYFGIDFTVKSVKWVMMICGILFVVLGAYFALSRYVLYVGAFKSFLDLFYFFDISYSYMIMSLGLALLYGTYYINGLIED